MNFQQLQDYLTSEGFRPGPKVNGAGKEAKQFGLYFSVSPIVKEKWLDHLSSMCMGSGYDIYYNNQTEEINIEFSGKEAPKVYEA